MTHITLPRAVVEQALEALESNKANWPEKTNAITALRAALAQQAEPVQGWTDADADAARLALELECLLTDKDVPLAAASRWWGSAHEALQLHRKRLADALAQQAEPAWVCPESPEHRHKKPGHCEDCGKPLVLAQQAEPVASLNAWAADRLARHGIQACLYPNCVGGQSGTVCHKHCPTPCPDCRGVGYDASGQLCACQQNPSF